MPCYPCTHCNKCGLFSMKMDIRCKTCDEPIVPGAEFCPKCGNSYIGNMKTGKMSKPEGSVDYYTQIEEALKESEKLKQQMGKS